MMRKRFNQNGLIHTLPLLLIIAAVGIISFLLLTSTAPLTGLFGKLNPKPNSQAAGFVAPTPMPNCQFGSTTPVGQANPSAEYEPMGAVWCYPLAIPPSPTRVTGANDWVDEFNINQQLTRFKDGDLDYKVYNNLGPGAKTTSYHYLNANHWMVDVTGGQRGGAMLRPNRSFKFENGKFVVETDVAAGIPNYNSTNGGHDIWPEIVITDSDTPNANLSYAGDSFEHHWVLRCIPYPDQLLGCAYLNNTTITGNESNYVWKGSWFEHPTSTSFSHQPGDTVSGTNQKYGNFYRKCPLNQIDLYCRDRFRFEITKTSFKVYVNGVLYQSNDNLTGANQISDALVNGNVYVYMADWTTPFSVAPDIRYHWDRLAINPHDEPGHIQPPTTASSFCPGQPNNTCPILTTGVGSIAPTNNNVDLLDFIYNPQNITIAQGTTVTWTNRGTQPHSVNSDISGLFDSGIFNPGQTYAHTFTTAGVFSYHCLPHPGMVGTVTVLPGNGSPLPSSTPTPSTTPSPVTVGTTFNLTMNGAKNVPVVATSGTGTGKLILISNETVATLTMSYSGLTSNTNAAHIHGPATTTQSAGILFPVNFGTGLSGTNLVTTITGLTNQQVTDLKNGLWYVNVHSTNFPNGEIRGQLISATTPTPIPTPAPTPSGKVGDLDGDGDVDIFDYSTLVANFGKTGTNLLGDLDKDGDVDIFDYSTLVANFGH